jgi:hypothetical protein
MRFSVPLALLYATIIPLARGVQFRNADAPSGASLKSLTWEGSGCSTDSNTTWTTDSEGVLAFATPSLKAITGMNSTKTEARKFCQFNLLVSYPAGWQYAPKTVAFSGYADIMAGISGFTRGDVYFSGEQKDVGIRFPVHVECRKESVLTTDKRTHSSWL